MKKTGKIGSTAAGSAREFKGSGIEGKKGHPAHTEKHIKEKEEENHGKSD